MDGGGYLGVDFFFLVGGLFLAQHYDRHKTEEEPMVQARDYLILRLKRLYPPYLCAVLIMVAIQFVLNGMSAQWLWAEFNNTKWQYLLLHFLCPDVGHEMRSVWFLSPYVFVSYLLYFLLSYNKRFFVGICPAVSIFVLVHIFFAYGTLAMQSVWEGWLFGGVMRAFAEMALGVYLYEVVKLKGDQVRKKWQNWLTGVAEIAILAVLLVMFHKCGLDKNDFFMFFLIVVFVRLSYMRDQRYRNPLIRKVVSWLGSINYWMFLLHLIVSRLLVIFMPGHVYWKILLVYIAAVVAASSAALCAENKLRELWSRKRNAAKG